MSTMFRNRGADHMNGPSLSSSSTLHSTSSMLQMPRSNHRQFHPRQGQHTFHVHTVGLNWTELTQKIMAN